MIYNTRKERKYRNKKRHNKTMKGGVQAPEPHKTPDQIMREIKEQHSDPLGDLSEKAQTVFPELQKLPSLPSLSESISSALPDVSAISTDSIMDSKVVESASTLAQGVAVNALEKAGNVIGLDLNNPEQVSEKLENINETLVNPENVEKVKDIASNLANVGLIGLQAVDPFIDPLMDKVAETAKKGIEKTQNLVLSTAANVSELFLGPIIGIPRTVMSALEAGQSVINTGSEIITTTSDTINAATQNFKQIANENKNVLDRTSQSISNFVNPINSINSVNPSGILKKNIPNQNQYLYQNQNKMGGTRKKMKHRHKNKNYKSKSKKVRFYFE